jgi:probable phosphoglycerate mutase
MGAAVRVVIVRHGESTYNVQQRVQGRIDGSAGLTPRGVEQASYVRTGLNALSFDRAFASPLSRARQTAESILQASPTPALEITPLLYEINLSTWEGMTFQAVQQNDPEGYRLWRTDPAQLQMDGFYPVRDLWQQAREFWAMLQTQTLPADSPLPTILVVAHSGINRALISTALGLDEAAYLRLGMNNCSISVLNFLQGLDQPPQLESLNLTNHLGECLPPKKGGLRLLLVRHGETEWNRQKRFQGQRDIPLNAEGERQAQLAAAFLKHQPLHLAFSSPLKRPWHTAEAILQDNDAARTANLVLQPVDTLQEISHGLWEGLLDSEVEASFPGQLASWLTTPDKVQMPEGENLEQVWGRATHAWDYILKQVDAHDGDANALVVAHDAVNKSILCQMAGLGPEAFWLFKQGNGAVSVIDYPNGAAGTPVLRSLNITSHLGGIIDCTTAGAL